MLKRTILIALLALSISQLLIYFGESPIAGANQLNKGWKFHPGDDMAWSKPDFDDRDWIDIDPTGDMHDSFPSLKKSVIGWLRFKWPKDSLRNAGPLAGVIQQVVASEIYLNGQLLKTYGTVSANPSLVKTYDPLWKPLAIPVSGDSIQTLAIRVAVKPDALYTTIFETQNPLFSIQLLPFEKAVMVYHEIASKTMAFEFFLIAICVMLMILHFALYSLYPSQKANLYFALYALFSCLGFLLQLHFYIYSNEVIYRFYEGNLVLILLTCSGLLMFYSLQKFLERKNDFLFKVILVMAIVSVVLDAYPYRTGWKMGAPLLLLFIQINLAREAFISIKAKQKGAWIIAAGAIAALVFFAVFISQGTFIDKPFAQNFTDSRRILFVLFTLSLPVSSSVFLALDFAFTNKSLVQKIKENNELAEKNLSQQKEKQQLLSSMNQQLEVQVKERTEELSNSLENLKLTQSQLIQSEKMASLGELTAGIAHEIQNPLNFVNNFSELNNELIDEMQSAYGKGDTVEGTHLANDIKQNLDKINFHGKRADAIVKGMLLHSRTNTGQQEATDINALADEYLRLSYHGMRGKEKNFNAQFETDFDPHAGKINTIPQEIGRVFLNLFNNAFYAVHQKAGIPDKTYLPLVTVSTKRMQHSFEIHIKDNGIGIPENVAGKIFQPFFTTKPTGQGTGLGLSMSYDIIKAHGGEIKVESKEGEGAEFIVQLPIV